MVVFTWFWHSLFLEPLCSWRAAWKKAAQGALRKPVSYTHLDVYKRQLPCRSNTRSSLQWLYRISSLSLYSFVAVSYTHLDVYKRQSQTCSPVRSEASCSLGVITSMSLYRSGGREEAGAGSSMTITCLLYTSRCV